MIVSAPEPEPIGDTAACPKNRLSESRIQVTDFCGFQRRVSLER
jgi:hypothetical protein